MCWRRDMAWDQLLAAPDLSSWVYFLNRFPLQVHPLSPSSSPLPPKVSSLLEGRKKEAIPPKFHHFTPLGVLVHVTFSRKTLGKRGRNIFLPFIWRRRGCCHFCSCYHLYSSSELKYNKKYIQYVFVNVTIGFLVQYQPYIKVYKYLQL
ncbi:hypothetical protein KIL84_011173 [Mauremys mutica]|uniref:Uncharacterized protein n=1 Tax=Mauremys mutica TaxID=74926 RepID=A0A9D3XD54_9SAUR|nr:hypothetical protein KIL84_011173 [Mauremys mutica]